MPTYQYACTECGGQLEAVQKFTDEPLTVHEDCGGRLRKVFSPVGIVFKGSGFYRTDSRGSGHVACGPGRVQGQRIVVRGLRGLVLGGLLVRLGRRKGSGGAGEHLREQHLLRRKGRLTPMAAVADIGVIGGSGFYEFLTGAEEVRVDTPFGEPSETVLVGEAGGKRVAFLPRHGKDHRFPPHKIPFRANLWAMRALGVRRILSPSAVGSLTASYGPGTLVVPDQLVDRTTGRVQTYYDESAVHVPFADPYCPSGRALAIGTARNAGWEPAGSGTLVIIDGPRFSTRAESQWYAAQGWTLIGMTAHPEAVLARELALCYTNLALVTDLDAGVEEGEGVTQAEVFEVFAKNIARLRELVANIIEGFPEEREDDLCAHALDGIQLPIELP